MAIDTTPSTVATNALQAIPFSSLIGGPLQAAIQAQSQAAITTWEFINNVGLTGPEGDRKAISVVFQYQKGGQMVNLIVPLLAIVPIPYISIDAMTIDFTANISASSSNIVENTESTATSGEASAKARVGWGPFSVEANFKANYSSKKDSKATQESKYSVEYTMNIHVGASQSAMPAGLASVLNILNSSIQESPTNGSMEPSPFIVTMLNQTDNSVDVTVQLKNSMGQVVSGVLVAPASTTVNFGTAGVITIAPTSTGSDTTGANGFASFTMKVTTPATDFTNGVTQQIAFTAANVPNPVTSGTNAVNTAFSVTVSPV